MRYVRVANVLLLGIVVVFLSLSVVLEVTILSAAIVSVRVNLNAIFDVSCAT